MVTVYANVVNALTAMLCVAFRRLSCSWAYIVTLQAALSTSATLSGLVARNEPGTWFSLKARCLFLLPT